MPRGSPALPRLPCEYPVAGQGARQAISMPGVKSIPDDDFLVVEDLDLGDESELRQIVAEVESMISSPGRGLRVSVLTSEQWKTVVSRLLPSRLRRGVEHHIHTLRDPRDGQHLLVSPSAVQGINEGSRFMYQDVVYAILRCLSTDLPEPLRHGADDLLAEAAGDRLEIPLFCRNYPRERSIVMAITEILSRQFGYRTTDWTLELRRSPERVLLALSKSKFLPYWQEQVRIELGKQAKASELVELLVDPELDFESNLGRVTADALLDYAEEKR
jgi:hypothetical protein